MSASPKQAASRRKKIVLTLVSGLLMLFTLTEFFLRVNGKTEMRNAPEALKDVDGKPLFATDALLGFKGIPGAHSMILYDKVPFTFTHNSEGYRITRPEDSAARADAPEVWILGCSFTHGYGVQDYESFPWRLQEKMPWLDVRNYGMSAYSTTHAWLQLQQLLKEGRKPKMVILAWADFHAQRNVADRYWMKALHGRAVVKEFAYPFARFAGDGSGKNGELEFHYRKIGYDPLPGASWLAMVNSLDNQKAEREAKSLRSEDVSFRLIQMMDSLTRAAGAHFVLVNIAASGSRQNHPGNTKPIRTDVYSRVINDRDILYFTDISQNLERTDLRIHPADAHPGARVHGMYAADLQAYLGELSLGKEFTYLRDPEEYYADELPSVESSEVSGR